jgi:glutamate decarboxylase
VSEESHYCLDPREVRKNLDENTIGVFVILGSTYTGHFEPVHEISKILDDFEAETGHNIPIHVDGASGAMVAPFIGYKEKWSFDNPRVVSINTSGHSTHPVPPQGLFPVC